MSIVPVTICMQDRPDGPITELAVIGETIAPGLAITPGIQEDGSLHGGWTITHLLSGRMVFTTSVCLTCLRIAARKLTESDIDWTRTMESLVADPVVLPLVRAFAIAANACEGETCSVLTDQLVG
ncbi:hypothetical protein [Micromonospora sp. NPDC023644]|uniref:hypothetical protein n=1 Tax=Micromonospora sp. NPDC023644 TaxID=3154321 RepID=UPI0033E0DC6D